MTEGTMWEYTVQSYGSTWRGPRDEELQAALNNLGEQGWEVFWAAQLEGSNKVRIVAKRPLTTAVRRRSAWPG